MATNRMLIERRHHRRYSVPQGAFVICHPNTRLPCPIMNISKGGLAFCYMPGERNLDDSEELDIFCCETEFCLANLPFETVNDCLMPDAPRDGITLHRRGVKFGRMAAEQLWLVEHFIDSSAHLAGGA